MAAANEKKSAEIIAEKIFAEIKFFTNADIASLEQSAFYNSKILNVKLYIMRMRLAFS